METDWAGGQLFCIEDCRRAMDSKRCRCFRRCFQKLMCGHDAWKKDLITESEAILSAFPCVIGNSWIFQLLSSAQTQFWHFYIQISSHYLQIPAALVFVQVSWFLQQCKLSGRYEIQLFLFQLKNISWKEGSEFPRLSWEERFHTVTIFGDTHTLFVHVPQSVLIRIVAAFSFYWYTFAFGFILTGVIV